MGRQDNSSLECANRGNSDRRQVHGNQRAGIAIMLSAMRNTVAYNHPRGNNVADPTTGTVLPVQFHR
jgi:hypothetical protein